MLSEVEDLSRLLRNVLSPVSPPCLKVPSLNCLCIRTAAIYATTSLYGFHDRQKALHVQAAQEDGEGHHHDQVHHHHHQQQQPNHQVAVAASDSFFVSESMWEEVFPLLDQHFFQLVPSHMYEQFLDSVLCALEVAGHFDNVGKQLTQYVILFFPKHMRRFRAQQRYNDRVMIPTICCLNKCSNLEELYLEKADSPNISTYLLAHILKFMNQLKVLSLPKQCDDDVASIIGINCPKLESIVLTGANMSNLGMSFLLCCKQLHTVIMQGELNVIVSDFMVIR